MHRNFFGILVNCNHITCTEVGNRSTNLSFRSNVTNNESVSTTWETSICQEGNLVPLTFTNDHWRQWQHFWHTRTTLRTYKTYNNYIAINDFIRKNCFDGIFFWVKYFSRTSDVTNFNPWYFGNRTFWSQVPVQDDKRTVCTFWIFKWHDNFLTWCKVCKVSQVLSYSLTSTCDTITVKETILKKVFHNGWYTTNIVKILEDILTWRFQVSQVRHTLLEIVEIFKCQINVSCMSNSEQVKCRICWTTKCHCDSDGIFKGFTCQDIWWLKSHF